MRAIAELGVAEVEGNPMSRMEEIEVRINPNAEQGFLRPRDGYWECHPDTFVQLKFLVAMHEARMIEGKKP